MSRPLAIVRPQPGWDATAQAARERGIAVIGHPLFVAEPLEWEAPEGPFDAILAGSAAVFREGGPGLTGLRSLPVLAVGKATAHAAEEAGFDVAMIGTGGLQGVLDQAPPVFTRMLRLAGEERVDLRGAEGRTITDRVVYRMRALPLSDGFLRALPTENALVALHSAAAARHFAAECDRSGLARGALEILALGPRIAQAAGEGWAAVHTCATPADATLIGKAAALCQ